MEQYSSTSYWNQRYASIEGTYDWYTDWPSLRSHLPVKVKDTTRVLHIGCGTSRLAQDLYEDGVRNVKSIDISPNCINSMREMFPHLDYEVMDVAKAGVLLPEMSVDVVIDKGFLDTVLCGKRCEERVSMILKGLHRLLSSSGYLLIISVGCPASRLMYLESSELWDVSVVKVPKRYFELFGDRQASGCAMCGVDGACKCAQESGGCEATPESPASLEEGRYHFVYVCRKRV